MLQIAHPLHIPPTPSARQLSSVGREDQVLQLVADLADAGSQIVAGHSVHTEMVVHGTTGVGKSTLIVHALSVLRGASLLNQEGAEITPPGIHQQEWLVLHLSGKHTPSLAHVAHDLQALLDAAGRQMQAPNGDPLQYADASLGILPGPPLCFAPLRGHIYPGLHNALYPATRQAISDLFSVERQLQAMRAAQPPQSDDIRQATGTALLCAALNPFFDACTRAKIPTILVVDELEGVSFLNDPARRAELVRITLGALTGMRCTSLVVGLRSEYMHESIYRNFRHLKVLPMSTDTALKALDGWLSLRIPHNDAAYRDAVRALAQRLLANLPPDDSVVPWEFSRLLQWLPAREDMEGDSGRAILEKCIRRTYAGGTWRLLLRISNAMSEQDAHNCLKANPLDPAPFGITRFESIDLKQAGLLSPAFANSPSDPRIFLSPLFGWLRVFKE